MWPDQATTADLTVTCTCWWGEPVFVIYMKNKKFDYLHNILLTSKPVSTLGNRVNLLPSINWFSCRVPSRSCLQQNQLSVNQSRYLKIIKIPSVASIKRCLFLGTPRHNFKTIRRFPINIQPFYITYRCLLRLRHHSWYRLQRCHIALRLHLQPIVSLFPTENYYNTSLTCPYVANISVLWAF